ncbi:MAG: TonB-dependent receptor [Chitinophagaceae bacterium]
MNFLPANSSKRLTPFLIILLLLVSCLSSFAEKIEQRWIVVSKDYTSLSELFKTIKTQTGLTLFYSNDVLNDKEKVRVHGGKVKLDDLLGEIFTPRNIAWIYKEQFVILQKKPYQPQGIAMEVSAETIVAQAFPTLIGRVTSQDGTPVDGASVQVKGTQQGTTTKPDGSFELKDVNPSGATLVVSYIGFKKYEVLIGNKTTFTIVLTSATSELSDVVVVGYGTRKKSDLTGAVATLSADNFKERAASNFGEAMAGQMAGVQVQQISGAPGGEGLSIRVRGTGSITQSNSPLYVVDGYPMEESAFNLINPSDVESLQVLKDASSTAIYGSRGANGVVIITTKRGKSGKTSVNFSAFKGLQQNSKSIGVMNRDQYVQWFMDGRNQAWLDQSIIASDPDKTAHTINDPNTRRGLYPSSSTLYAIPDGKNGYKYNFLDPQSVSQMEDNNWQNLLFRNANIEQYQVSAMGGSDKTSYSFSGSYMKQDGIVINTNYQRYNFRSNVESKLSKTFKVGMNLSAFYANGNEQVNGKYSPIMFALQLPPMFPLRNPDGSYGSMVRNPEILPGDVASPIGIAQQVKSFRKKYGWLGTIYAEWDLLKDLKYRININGSIKDNALEGYQPSTVDLDASKGPRPAQASDEKNTDYDWVVEQTLNYAKKFADKHDLTLLGGFSSQKHSNDYFYGEARGFPNDNIQTLNAGNIYQLSTTKSAYSMVSYFARANYTYDSRYLFTATVRTDGSSRFGDNKKWGVFPSVSAAWRISQEKFMANITDKINDLKVRVSYGIAGNNRIGNYSSIGLLSTGFYPTGDAVQNTVNPNSVPNANLGWEKVLQTDAGFDLGLFNNRIRLEGDYYSSKSIDLLLNVPVPTVTGYTNQIQNIGKVLNTGLEFLLTTKNMIGKFNWSSNFNIAFNKNEVLEVGPGGQPIYASAPNANNAFITLPGHPIASYFGYVYQGVFTTQKELDQSPHLPADKVGDGRYKDVNGDGKLDQTDKAIIGNNQPKFSGGFSNNFSYKNFTLSAQLSYTYGAEAFSFFKRMVGIYHGDRNALIEQTGRWRSVTDVGDGEHFRATRNPTGWQRDPSSAWVTDISYIRLRNMTLAYDFKANAFKSIKISGLRVYATGQNIFTWTKFPGYDPENSSEGDGLTRGGDYLGYPAARSIILGLNLSF